MVELLGEDLRVPGGQLFKVKIEPVEVSKGKGSPAGECRGKWRPISSEPLWIKPKDGSTVSVPIEDACDGPCCLVLWVAKMAVIPISSSSSRMMNLLTSVTICRRAFSIPSLLSMNFQRSSQYFL